MRYAWAGNDAPGFDHSGERRCLAANESTMILHVDLWRWSFPVYVRRAHSFWLARRAPSARAPSFAQAIVGTTVGAPAKVAKPQSTPGTTFSRPTSSA